MLNCSSASSSNATILMRPCCRSRKRARWSIPSRAQRLTAMKRSYRSLAALLADPPARYSPPWRNLDSVILFRRAGPGGPLHAIANRLAATALQRISKQKLLSALVDHAPARLLQSFSRRLGYLDSSKEAREIVEGWLAPDGLL